MSSGQLLRDEAKLHGTTKLIERWKAEMPTEQEMRPKDKYSVFSRYAKVRLIDEACVEVVLMECDGSIIGRVFTRYLSGREFRNDLIRRAFRGATRLIYVLREEVKTSTTGSAATRAYTGGLESWGFYIDGKLCIY